MNYIKLVLLFLGFGTIVNAQKAACTDDCCKKKESTAFKCNLTTPEFRERKATVIADLKKIVKKKKELKDGYAYKFDGSDEVVAKLNEFIKTESECCGFLKFDVIRNESKSEAWLHITGDKGVKEFLKEEIEM